MATAVEAVADAGRQERAAAVNGRDSANAPCTWHASERKGGTALRVPGPGVGGPGVPFPLPRPLSSPTPWGQPRRKATRDLVPPCSVRPTKNVLGTLPPVVGNGEAPQELARRRIPSALACPWLVGCFVRGPQLCVTCNPNRSSNAVAVWCSTAAPQVKVAKRNRVSTTCVKPPLSGNARAHLATQAGSGKPILSNHPNLAVFSGDHPSG